jgi:hypothetical protein
MKQVQQVYLEEPMKKMYKEQNSCSTKVRDAEMKPVADKMEKHMEITLQTSGAEFWLFTESHYIANRRNFGEIPVVAKESEPFRQNLPVAKSKSL